MATSRHSTRPVVSRDFLIRISTPLIVAAVMIFGTKLEVSGISYASSWHQQSNHRLEMSRWDFIVPASWYPLGKDGYDPSSDYTSLVRASFFHPSSQTVSIYPSPVDLEDFEASIQNTSDAPWGKSSVFQLRGEPGNCFLRNSAGHSSGYCIFPKHDLIICLKNLDKRSMKEVAELLTSTTPHPLRKRLSESRSLNR